MRSLGFDFQKGNIRFCLLEGSKSSPKLVLKERVIINPTPCIPEYMDRFDSIFRQIIKAHSPSKIGYRLSLGPNKEQIHNLIFPAALLNNISYQEGISCIEYVKQNFTSTKFGLPKGLNMFDYCDDHFGCHPPYWDDNQKNALLSAWLCL